MAEEYTCIECENLYDDMDGDTDERMCNNCIIQYHEDQDFVKRVNGIQAMKSAFIQLSSGNKERRNLNIIRSTTVHYPDWNKKNKEYITRKRKVDKLKKGETTS